MSKNNWLDSLAAGYRSGMGRRSRQSACRRLDGESLESRLVLAGNVLASFNSATKTLVFTGDTADNSIQVWEDPSFNAFVTGVAGTTINGAATKSINELTGFQIPLSVIVNCGDGADAVTFDTASPFYFGGAMTINGGNGNDTVNLGTTFGQWIEFGALTINGNSGNDVVAFRSDSSLESSSIALLNGGGGNDSYLFDTDANLCACSITDSAGADTLDFSATTNLNVSVNLSVTEAQTVNAGLTLTLTSGSSIENVTGGAKSDTLVGNTLANRLSGAGGNDTLTGGAGNDVLIGGAGNDVYVFDTDLALGSDSVNEGGGGVDTLNFSATTTRSVSVNLGSGAAQVVNAGLTLALKADNTVENVIGGSLADTITGNSLSNILVGGPGADTLSAGSGGRNILIGGLGADILNGSSGEDLLIGGRSTLERNVTALLSLRKEWGSAADYDTRVAHLLGTLGGGLNGTYILSSSTVKEDATKDQLTGSTGRDWYFRNSSGATVSKRDTVADSDLDSVFTEISTWL